MFHRLLRITLPTARGSHPTNVVRHVRHVIYIGRTFTDYACAHYANEYGARGPRTRSLRRRGGEPR